MELVGDLHLSAVLEMLQTGNVAGEEFKQQNLLCPVISAQICPIKTTRIATFTIYAFH